MIDRLRNYAQPYVERRVCINMLRILCNNYVEKITREIDRLRNYAQQYVEEEFVSIC